jgi:hypothetical protein
VFHISLPLLSKDTEASIHGFRLKQAVFFYCEEVSSGARKMKSTEQNLAPHLAENTSKNAEYESELRGMTNYPTVKEKYSTGSSVYAEDSIVNSNSDSLIYRSVTSLPSPMQ